MLLHFWHFGSRHDFSLYSVNGFYLILFQFPVTSLKTQGRHIRENGHFEVMMGLEKPENIRSLAFTVGRPEPRKWSCMQDDAQAPKYGLSSQQLTESQKPYEYVQGS